MPECKRCGKDVDLPFECKFCGGYYCLEHRLPENHDCPNLPPRRPLGSWQTRKEMAIARAEEKADSKFVSEGELHFIKESRSEKPNPKKPFPIKKFLGFLILAFIIALLVWQLPAILSYFQKPSYTKLTIAHGQYQISEFKGNTYTISYDGKHRTLTVVTPLFEARIYQPVYESQIINCDLGLEIKVDKVTDSYITIYVKPSY